MGYGPFMSINISKLLKSERQSRNLTAGQAAAECQLDEESYLRIEYGKKALTTKELIAVAAFLGTPPETLIGDEVHEETIKYRASQDVKNSGNLSTIEKARRLFEEMVAQKMLREN